MSKFRNRKSPMEQKPNQQLSKNNVGIISVIWIMGSLLLKIPNGTLFDRVNHTLSVSVKDLFLLLNRPYFCSRTTNNTDYYGTSSLATNAVRSKWRSTIRNMFHSIRFDSIRFDSIRFDSIRFDSIRFDSVHSKLDEKRKRDIYGMQVQNVMNRRLCER
jgi:hypothetical protein